jgi:hypothetical protein
METLLACRLVCLLAIKSDDGTMIPLLACVTHCEPCLRPPAGIRNAAAPPPAWPTEQQLKSSRKISLQNRCATPPRRRLSTGPGPRRRGGAPTWASQTSATRTIPASQHHSLCMARRSFARAAAALFYRRPAPAASRLELKLWPETIWRQLAAAASDASSGRPAGLVVGRICRNGRAQSPDSATRRTSPPAHLARPD